MQSTYGLCHVHLAQWKLAKVTISMDFMLNNHNLNLIGPANIPAWTTNYWQWLPDVSFFSTEHLLCSLYNII